MAKAIENVPAGAVTVREAFGTEELVAQGDLMATASAASVAKEIEVRAILAERHPRNIDKFREQILHYCKHPDFAEQALYCRKVGRKQNTEGKWEDSYAINFSIRFIEAALPLFRNVFYATRVVYEDPKRLLMNVQVYDVELNVGGGQDAMLSKLVERREAKDRVVVGARITSENRQVFIVEATRDEMRNVFGAERSKLIRDYGQKLLPFHILNEARRLIDATNADENAKDPDAARKKILDAFASVGVSTDMLAAYLERDLAVLTPKDLAELRALHTGLREGEFSWADIMRVRSEPAEGAPEDPNAPEVKKAAKLKDRILDAREKAAKREAPAAEAKPE